MCAWQNLRQTPNASHMIHAKMHSHLDVILNVYKSTNYTYPISWVS